MASASPEPDAASGSSLLQRIESEKTRLRHEIEKKILEDENIKLKAKVVELTDLNEHWKTKFYTLEAENDVQHTESDANMIDIYNRIQGMETKIQKLEADRRALLHDIKTKDAQIDEWKEKFIDLQSQSEKRIDITKVNFSDNEKVAEVKKEEEKKEEKVEEKKEEKKEVEEEKEAEKPKENGTGSGGDESVEKIEEGEKKEDEDKKEEEVKAEATETKEEPKEEVKEEPQEEPKEVKEEVPASPRAPVETPKEDEKKEEEEKPAEVTKEADEEKKDEEEKEDEEKKEDEEEKKEDEKEDEDDSKKEEEDKPDEEKTEEERKAERKEATATTRKKRSRLEKAMGNLEFISTSTLDTQFARAIQHAKSVSPVTPTSKNDEQEAIADILKHSESVDSDSFTPRSLSMSSGGEGEVDDLMSNLNKITYHEGATRLPTTYSFSDLESVSSYGTLSDIEAEELKAKEEEGSDTPRNGTLRISGEKKEAVVVEKETEKEEEEKKEIDPQVYTKKVILAQSVVRKHQARRKYKQIRKRAAISKEIFLTERTYVKHLHTCIKVFLRPLRQRAMVSETGFITIDKLQTIFSTFEIIMRANYALLKRLHNVIRAWNMNTIIGPVFTELLPLLEPHVDYIVNFENAQNLLKEATKESTALNMFLKASLQNPDLDCKDLADFLIMPVQRIPRYVMLLHDLLKNTPSTHPDYANLHLAFTRMRDFADNINERKRTHYRIFQIKDCITGVKDVDLLHTGRFMLGEGDLKTKKGTEHYFLFNDVLVACKVKKGSSSSSSPALPSPSLGNNSPTSASTPDPVEHVLFKFISKINIDNSARVEDTKEAKYPTNFKLVLGDHSSHVFTAPTVEDKQKWMGAFNKAILHSPNAYSGPHTGYDISTTDLRHL